jgi:hypothetical protein
MDMSKFLIVNFGTTTKKKDKMITSSIILNVNIVTLTTNSPPKLRHEKECEHLV